MHKMNYILGLQPAYKDYIWGGDRLKSEYEKKSDLNPIAESWELSCNKNGHSIVKNGEYKDLSLCDAIEKMGSDCLGTNGKAFSFFPVLIKLIDAKQSLSIQVHPNDEYALKNENSYGKTEMWYVVDADEDAFLYYGFNKDIDKSEFVKRVENNTLTEVLNKAPVKKGDVFFINAGMVHAINEGILIAEIQQNADTTYRIYDYGRVGQDGKQRPLHLDKAVDVIDFSKSALPMNMTADTNEKELLSKCEYFTVYKLNITGSAKEKSTAESFHSILILEGEGKILSDNTVLSFKKGDCFFIPAETQYEIHGDCKALLTMV